MRQWTIDAFASGPFRGNPACVVEPFDTWPEDAWMHSLAMENNQAETAFLLKTADPARFGLRWRTPAIEVPICGHATLASTHMLFEELGVNADRIVFETKSGELTVERDGSGYQMDFPAAGVSPISAPAGLVDALGAKPLEVFTSRFLLAIMANETTVRDLTPDIMALKPISAGATEGPGNVIVAALADPGKSYDIVTRFFAPGSGIPEDPTTGGAHCILAPFFAERLGKSTIQSFQAYPGRGGDLTCVHWGERVLLKGKAVTVIESRLRVQ